MLAIRTRLQWCSLLGGTFADLEDAAECELRLAEQCYLVFLNLTNIDIIAHINRAFGTAFSGTLRVERAGFFTYGCRGALPPATPLCEAFPDVVPAPIGIRSKPVPDGTSFWFELALQGSLFNGLVELGNWKGGGLPTRLALYASLDNSLPAKEAFQAGTYTLLLPDVTLFRIFSFHGVQVCYRFTTQEAGKESGEGSAEFFLSGYLDVALFGHSCSFDGELVVTAERVTATLGMKIGPSEPVEPFLGAMRGCFFTDLRFALDYSRKDSSQSSFAVVGTVRYGNPQAQLKLDGRLRLRGGSPDLALIRLNGTLSLAGLLAGSTRGSGGYPADMLDLRLREGSRLYYRASAPAGQGPDPEYLPGFHVDAFLTLAVGGLAVDLHGIVDIADDGLAASIALEHPLSLLGILSFGGKGGIGGPDFRFSTKNGGSMGLICSVALLQADFGVDISIGVRQENGKTKLTGSLSPLKSHSVLPEGARLDFSYSSDGFRIENWPTFAFAKELFDLLEKLSDLASSGGCGKLASFLTKNCTKSVFSAKPRLGERDGGACLFVDASCTFQFLGKDVVGISLPGALQIGLPKDASLDNLPDLMGRAIKDAAFSFVECLYKNPDKLAAVLVFSAGKNAPDIALTLICKGLVDGFLYTLAEAGAEALAAGAGVAGVLKLISEIHKKCCFVAGTLVALPDGGTAPIESLQAGDVVLGAANVSNRVLAVHAPRLGNRALFGFNNGPLFVTAEHPFMTKRGWASIHPEASRRENPDMDVVTLTPGDSLERLGGDSEHLWAIQSGTAPPDTLVYNLALEGNNTYYANRYLVHNKDEPPKPGGNPDPPANMHLAFDGECLSLSWKPMPFATGYRARLLRPDRTALLEKELTFSTTPRFSIQPFPPSGDVPAGQYTWEACSLRTGGKDSVSATRSFLLLGVPHGLEAEYDVQANALRLQWRTVAEALGYRAVASLASGESSSADFGAQTTSGEVRLTAPPMEDISLTLRALGQTGGDVRCISGPFSAPVVVRTETPARLAKQARQRGDSGEACARALRARFPVLLIHEACAAMAGAGYPYPDVLGLAVAWPECRDEEFLMALRRCYGKPGNMDELAVYAWARNQNGAACGVLLHSQFPAAVPIEVAKAMAGAGYAAEATSQGLHTAWPDIGAVELLSILAEVYGTAGTIEEAADRAFKGGKDGAACGTLLHSQFPAAVPVGVAKAMAGAGYAAEATSEGLHAAWPDIGAVELLSILAEVYGTAGTIEKAADQAFRDGKNGAACGTLLHSQFPGAGPMEVAKAMAGAGYAAEATSEGLHAAWPDIGAVELLSALAEAYGKSM